MDTYFRADIVDNLGGISCAHCRQDWDKHDWKKGGKCPQEKLLKPVKFWMVLIDGTPSCSKKHETLEAARLEACRLLQQNANKRGVTILEAIEHGELQYPPIIWEMIQADRPALPSGEEGTFQEWLQESKIGWTDLEHSETP